MATGKANNVEYTVGLICALPLELTALMAMLDEEHEDARSQDPSDDNHYTLGRIANHNVVIACLPAGVYGKVKAATVAAQMVRSFQQVRFSLLVGIGGGVPSKTNDIRLGDVVVSQPKDSFGGVVQYDRGKRISGGKFERTGTLNKPPQVLLTALSKIRARSDVYDIRLGEFLDGTLQKNAKLCITYGRPLEGDYLYHTGYEHVDQSFEQDDRSRICIRCDRKKLVNRPIRKSPEEPEIHYGTIASGDTVLKDATSRDQISKDLGGVLCIEMEAAGLMDSSQCLVIRGICDYADSHKNKVFQNYSAATAAAYAKKLLIMMPSRDVKNTVAALKWHHPLFHRY